jgi:TRAP-type mannitol/chloroaromatic compound transport system substrate-binding protein
MLLQIMLLAVSITGSVGLARAETLNIQTSFNAGDFSTQYLTEKWLPKIKEMTSGGIEIVLTPNGSVVPAKDTPDAVAAGALDGDFTSVNYFSGREPAYAIMGDLISGYDRPEQMLGFCREGGGEAVMQKAADAVTGGGGARCRLRSLFTRVAACARADPDLCRYGRQENPFA